jgi:HK97 family phage major capsid protein
MSNRILQLQQDKTAALDQAQALLALAEKEKRPLTEAEQSSYDTHFATASNIAATIKREQDMASVNGNAFTDKPAAANLEVRDNVLGQPWGPEAQANETKQQRIKRLSIGFGNYLTAVRKGTLNRITSDPVDPRLLALNADFQKRASAAGASEMVPADGGFLIAPDFSDQLLELAHDTGVIYPMARDLPISEFTNAIKIPAVDEQSRKDGFRFGGIQAFWENEAQQLVGSKPTVALLELVLKKLTGLFYATNEVLADARLLGDLAMRGFGQEIGFKLDDGVIRGTGAGQLQGILNAPALVTIAAEAGQASKTVVYQNIIKMWARMWTPSRNNAVWLINQDVEPQLAQLTIQAVNAAGSSTTGGVPIFLPAGSGVFGPLSDPPLISSKALAGMAGTLFGRPVFVVEQACTLGTTGDIILADWQQYVMIKKDGLQAATSMHVRFLTDEMTYRWIYRTDGQSWFKTAITPFQGTNSLSPFVVLASR